MENRHGQHGLLERLEHPERMEQLGEAQQLSALFHVFAYLL